LAESPILYCPARRLTTAAVSTSVPVEEAIMAILDEEAPKKKRPHEIGEELGSLSLDELSERIALLEAEIARIEQALKDKRASANVAASFFKR
jgi:uncharacterized small protein (DUF1192 family)